jgi:transcriptional regulator with XRE-family HTH domain
MRHGIRKEIAARVGITPQHFGAILKGKWRPSRDLSCRLEAETGIPKEKWAFASVAELNHFMSEKYPKKQ